MKIELTPENAEERGSPSEIRCIGWAYPSRIPETDYLSDNMLPLFENPRSRELESHPGNLEYRTLGRC
jgi:hypothetical protein